MTPYVSIILPTRNGMPLVERCLRGVLEQKTPWPFEVVVIDSSSTDGTWQLLESLPVERVRIAPREFNHGLTRNFGASRARGKYLVFLVQDAIPADDTWLANLVAACESPGVAGAYSRQRPRAESNPITRYLTIGSTPNEERPARKALADRVSLAGLPPEEQFALAAFQNNSSCMRRSVWDKHPFAAVPYGEDVEWGRRVIEYGHAIAYEPSSVVYHSHDRSALYALKRAYADHYQAMELFGLVLVPSIFRLGKTIAWNTVQAWRFIAKTPGSRALKLRFGLLAPVYMTAVGVGQYLGARGYKWTTSASLWCFADRLLRRGV